LRRARLAATMGLRTMEPLMQDGSAAAPPANRDRLRYIDTLRAVAALLVVWLHSVQTLARVNPQTGRNAYIDLIDRIDVGHVGVVVFFLISGFVIPFSIRRDAPAPARAFLVKRFFRIFPAYWLSVPLAAAAIWWLWKQPFGGRELAWNFTLLQGALGYRNAEGVYWTLPVELVYYLVCTALLLTRSLFDPRRVALVAAALLVAFAALVSNFGRTRPLLDYGTVFWFLNLSIMLWGTLYRSRMDAPHAFDRTTSALYWMLLVAYLAVLPIAAPFTKTAFGTSWTWAYAAGFAIFVAGTRFVRVETRMTDWLGRISYSIYLFHVIVFTAIEWWLLQHPVGSAWRTQPFALYVAAGVVAVLAASTLSWALVEKPGMRLGHRLASRLERHANPLRASPAECR
jgi:peptidoglycan/LPS O-acetylase OafA/YrhL